MTLCLMVVPFRYCPLCKSLIYLYFNISKNKYLTKIVVQCMVYKCVIPYIDIVYSICRAAE